MKTLPRNTGHRWYFAACGQCRLTLRKAAILHRRTGNKVERYESWRHAGPMNLPLASNRVGLHAQVRQITERHGVVEGDKDYGVTSDASLLITELKGGERE